MSLIVIGLLLWKILIYWSFKIHTNFIWPYTKTDSAHEPDSDRPEENSDVLVFFFHTDLSFLVSTYLG